VTVGRAPVSRGWLVPSFGAVLLAVVAVLALAGTATTLWGVRAARAAFRLGSCAPIRSRSRPESHFLSASTSPATTASGWCGRGHHGRHIRSPSQVSSCSGIGIALICWIGGAGSGICGCPVAGPSKSSDSSRPFRESLMLWEEPSPTSATPSE